MVYGWLKDRFKIKGLIQNKMKKIFIALAILAILIMPLVKADTISPGYRTVTITNQITNINNFPDYVFVAVCLGRAYQNTEIILKDGDIPPFYKFCKVSVYAIKKTEFNETYIKEIDKKSSSGNRTEKERYFNSTNVKEVISNIISYNSVSDTSTLEEINNFYTIDMQQIKVEPDEVVKERNNLGYFYTILPIAALLIIIFILIRRNKNECISNIDNNNSN